MAGIGMYGVYYSVATIEDGIVTGYNGAKTMGKAISASFTPNNPDENILWANNGVAESDASGASGGSLSVVLDRLKQDAAADLFGLKVEDVSVTVAGGSEPVTGKGLKFKGNEQSAPVGVAFIRQHQIDGNRNNHEVVLYRRATFAMPTESAQTSGDTIEWQTPEMNATVIGMEGDATHAWYEAVVFPTQAAAIAYIEQYFAAAVGV